MTNKLYTRGDRSAIEYEIGDGVNVITAGYQAVVIVPFDSWIESAEIAGRPSGSIIVDIWKCDYADYDAGSTHPVDGDSITASAPLTISSDTKVQDTTLTGWTRALTRGQVLAFNVDSITTMARALITLNIRKR